ncbi:GFA family protein [Alteromonas sp. 5E99-2]|uniref:GFA family protein n=1 Tax=Alteromonas sp. 5E99-2 TaxID=2817683 RepID=UPI001A99CE65|nr:GFA family protein [Alteromonas sp. 5E99-2]
MKGSCNCKSVSFSCGQEIRAIVNCHCNLCRKMNGASFSTYVVVAENELVLESSSLTSFKVSEHATKHFCHLCGTPIYNTNPKLPGLAILHLGAIDSDIEIQPAMNTYCESQLGWVNQIKDLHSFEKGLA